MVGSQSGANAHQQNDDRGAAALAERLVSALRRQGANFYGPIPPAPLTDTEVVVREVLGDRGVFLPNGTDGLAAKVAALPHLSGDLYSLRRPDGSLTELVELERVMATLMADDEGDSA